MSRISFVCAFFLVTELARAGQTPPSSPPQPRKVAVREDPRDMLQQCEALLHTPLQTMLPQPPTYRPISEAQRAAAARLRLFVTTALYRVVWPKSQSASEFTNAWRTHVIDLLGLCAYASAISRAQKAHDPLKLNNTIALLLNVLRQSEAFLTELAKRKDALKTRTCAELKAPAISAATTVSEEFNTPWNDFGTLPEDVINWAMRNHLTPEKISQILILALRVPKDGPMSDTSAAQKRLLNTHESQCAELGKLVFNCISIVIDSSLTGGTWVAAKGAITAARLKAAKLGAYILAEIEDDNSRALPIAQRIAQAWDQAEPQSEEERLALKAALLATLSEFLKMPIFDFSGLASFIVDFIWDKDTRALQHLLFFHLPQIIVPSLEPNEPAEVNEAANKMADDVSTLARDVASTYLWRDNGIDTNFRPIFLGIVQAAAKHIAYCVLTSEGDCDPTENALRSARLLTMIHIFLDHLAKGEYKVDGFNHAYVEAPLVDLVSQLLPHYLYVDEELQEESKYLTIGVVRTFLATFLSPQMICNSLINLELSKEGTREYDTRVGAEILEFAVAENLAHFPMGKALVRVVRSFLLAQGHLGVVNYGLVGVLNKYCETIGQTLLDGESSNVLPFVRHLLFKEVEGQLCARPFVGWIDDEAELKQRFEEWRTSVCKQVSRKVKKAGLAARFVYWVQFNQLLPTILEQTQAFAYSADKTALLALLLHYMLPVWRVDIAGSMRKH